MRTCTIGAVTIGADRPVRLMGVINCSPESFFSGSFVNIDGVRRRGEELIAQGADILDIGARSTAPGAPPLGVADERARMIGALEECAGLGVAVSVDTMHPEVLEACLAFDIHAVNDISGLSDRNVAALIGDAGLSAILMAAMTRPGDAIGVEATCDALVRVVERAHIADIGEFVLDPAVGRWTVEKTAQHDWDLCRQFSRFLAFDRPLLAAVSRKSFIGDLLDRPTEQRLAGSLAVTCGLILRGASLVRTHDVGETRDLIRVIECMERNR
ncbi:MAG: dihydropteroate synthase [Methanomicrobiaceae archaeon]|nr:dihydropteroate synthase [Methanomicrobiaceae archaeon]